LHLQIAAELNPAIDELFPEGCGVDIISEPGRFFTASAYTLTTHVIAKRMIRREEHDGEPPMPTEDDIATFNDEPAFMYYVNDGVYGSFNCLLYDHAEVEALVPGM